MYQGVARDPHGDTDRNRIKELVLDTATDTESNIKRLVRDTAADAESQADVLERYMRSNQQQLDLIRRLLEQRAAPGPDAADGLVLETASLPDYISEGDSAGYGARFAPLSLDAWPYYTVSENVGTYGEEPYQKNAALTHLLSYYRTVFGEFDIVADPFNKVNLFLEQVQGRLGEAVDRIETERDLLFTRDGKVYHVQGFRVLSRSVVAELGNLLSDPKIKEARGDRPARIALRVILENTPLRTLWADTIAYCLLLDQDLKGTNYVDKRRYDTNLNTYNALHRQLVADTQRFLSSGRRV